MEDQSEIFMYSPTAVIAFSVSKSEVVFDVDDSTDTLIVIGIGGFPLQWLVD